MYTHISRGRGCGTDRGGGRRLPRCRGEDRDALYGSDRRHRVSTARGVGHPAGRRPGAGLDERHPSSRRVRFPPPEGAASAAGLGRDAKPHGGGTAERRADHVARCGAGSRAAHPRPGRGSRYRHRRTPGRGYGRRRRPSRRRYGCSRNRDAARRRHGRQPNARYRLHVQRRPDGRRCRRLHTPGPAENAQRYVAAALRRAQRVGSHGRVLDHGRPARTIAGGTGTPAG